MNVGIRNIFCIVIIMSIVLRLVMSIVLRVLIGICLNGRWFLLGRPCITRLDLMWIRLLRAVLPLVMTTLRVVGLSL